MIRLVAFDWNGCLLADTADVIASTNHVLKHFGGNPAPLSVHQKTLAIPVIDFYVQQGVPREHVEKNSAHIAKLFTSQYESRIEKVRTRKNARELLAWLKAEHIECIIVSHHTVEGITALLKRLGLEGYFSAILAHESPEHAVREMPFTKEERLREYLKNKHYKPEETLIIGDSPEEVHAGKALGIHTVSITGGSYSEKRLKDAGPEHLIRNLAELIGIIRFTK